MLSFSRNNCLGFRPVLKVLKALSKVMEVHHLPRRMFVAEVLVGMATDTTLYLSRRGGGASSQQIDFRYPRFQFLMAPWAPRAPSVSC